MATDLPRRLAAEFVGTAFLLAAVTDTFSGILPGHAPAFIAAQLMGAVAATLFFGWLGAGNSEPVKD